MLEVKSIAARPGDKIVDKGPGVRGQFYGVLLSTGRSACGSPDYIFYNLLDHTIRSAGCPKDWERATSADQSLFEPFSGLVQHIQHCVSIHGRIIAGLNSISIHHTGYSHEQVIARRRRAASAMYKLLHYENLCHASPQTVSPL